MLGLEVALDARGLGFNVLGGEDEGVAERQGDDAGDGEDEEGVELRLGVVRVVGTHLDGCSDELWSSRLSVSGCCVCCVLKRWSVVKSRSKSE